MAQGTRLVIFVNPYHYTLLELWHSDGLWPSFEAWKRAIVAVTGRAGKSQLGTVTVLDFSGYSETALEPVPPAGGRKTAMRWYWEPGHYKSALGERVIARILNQDESFGQELTAATIDSVLQNITASRSKAAANTAPASPARQ